MTTYILIWVLLGVSAVGGIATLVLLNQDVRRGVVFGLLAVTTVSYLAAFAIYLWIHS